MKKVCLVSSLLAFSLISTGCEKDRIGILPDNFREYFDFQEESWWVYVNDSTGETDSTWVSEYRTDWILTETSTNTIQTEYLYVTRTRSSDFTEIRELFRGFTDGSTGEVFMKEGFGRTLWWPPESQNRPAELTLLGIYDSLNINGKVFYDVIGTRNDEYYLIPSSEGIGVVEFYYAKNIGLVHWHIKGKNDSWTLQNYYIKPL